MYTEPCHNADTHYIQLTFQVERFNILRHQSFQCLITYTINKISSAPWQRYAIISTHTHTHTGFLAAKSPSREISVSWRGNRGSVSRAEMKKPVTLGERSTT